jgi:hypothetical protein
MQLVVRASEVFAERKQAELRSILQEAKLPNSKVPDEKLSNGLTGVLAAERQRQLLGSADESSSLAANALMAEVVTIDNERRKKRVKDAIEDVKGPGKKATAEQLQKLQKLVQEMLGSERQIQLLGLEDEGASGEPAMELLSEAIEISYESHKAALKKVIEETKRPGNTMTRKEISKAVANMLGDERSRQLMGVGGDKADQEFSDLLDEAVKIAGEREKPASDSRREARVSVTTGPIQVIRRVPFHR